MQTNRPPAPEVYVSDRARLDTASAEVMILPNVFVNGIDNCKYFTSKQGPRAMKRRPRAMLSNCTCAHKNEATHAQTCHCHTRQPTYAYDM